MCKSLFLDCVTFRQAAYYENGAFWYFYRGRSVGFAPRGDVNLVYGDTLTSHCAYRMSWLLQGGSGYRAGCDIDIGGGWYKALYVNQANIPGD